MHRNMITNATFEKFALSNLRTPTSSSYRNSPKAFRTSRPKPHFIAAAAGVFDKTLPSADFAHEQKPVFYEFVKSGCEFLHLELTASTTAKVRTNERRWCGKHFFDRPVEPTRELPNRK